MAPKTKYALFCYDTENIGDEIQSLAASRFLPRVDYYINRDHIDNTHFGPNEKVKIIMNGWYLHPSSRDGKKHWPPTNPALSPLLASIHVSPTTESEKTFASPKSVAFLKKHSPVGARDKATLDFFQSIGVPSYYSGCLSLTLLPAPNIKKSDFVLAVDVDTDVIKAIQERTKRPIISLSVYRSFSLKNSEKFTLAKYWLYLYQSAHCIVTSRLHVILPSLALNTPVIALDHPDPDRYSGLIDLVNHYTNKEFIKNPKINIDHPRKNPTQFHALRDQLVKLCTDYTGFDSKLSYLGNQTIKDIMKSPDFIQAITKSVGNDYNLEAALMAEREQHAKDLQASQVLQNTIDNLHADLNKLQTNLDSLQSDLGAALTPGIKDSTKLLLSSLKRKLQK